MVHAILHVIFNSDFTSRFVPRCFSGGHLHPTFIELHASQRNDFKRKLGQHKYVWNQQ